VLVLRAPRWRSGVLVAFTFVQSRVIETALFPYAVLLQVTPVVAIAPLIIIWVKDPTASLGVLRDAWWRCSPIIANTIARACAASTPGC
jgi:NitT/TauT family transport system permease protein